MNAGVTRAIAMSTEMDVHPKLRLRPKRNPHLRRPIRQHPTFGELEYVNRSGWQTIRNTDDDQNYLRHAEFLLKIIQNDDVG